MRPGVDPFGAPHKPPLPPADYACRSESGLFVERNLAIPLRDGTRIYCDLYRPEGLRGRSDLPVLLAWGPYGKHALSNKVFWPASGVDPQWLSPLTPFEGPDPVRWGEVGYAVAVVDPRGAWLSEGDFHHNGRIEALDCCDAIQWLADQTWSNGKVGMTGVSYLACIQFWAAAEKPPALAAINPWEGFTDWYREFAYHGGIPETGLVPRASDSIRFSLGRTEDTWANVRAHPLMDDYWRSKEIDLEAVEVPAFVVASWSDHGLHSRGTLEAYKRISSRRKWLDVHGEKKWANYYRPESQAKREDFFDHFLKGHQTALSGWAPVRIQIRNRAGDAVVRDEAEWPLSRQRAMPLWLDMVSQTMGPDRPRDACSSRYDAREDRAVFDCRFDRDVELTGHAKLRLWVRCEDATDMDLFVALEKLDADGAHVGMGFYAFYENGPVALGWLRVSHRALDPMRSTALQPVQSHESEALLGPDDIVPIDIEIWPSSTKFSSGETLRLVVQGRDVHGDALPNMPFARHEQTRNRGQHILYGGGEYDSALWVPVIDSEIGK